MFPSDKIGDRVVCPICGQPYTLTEHHKFIRDGGYTCSWDCFMGKPRKAASSTGPQVSEVSKGVPLSQEEKKKKYYQEYYRRKKLLSANGK